VYAGRCQKKVGGLYLHLPGLEMFLPADESRAVAVFVDGAALSVSYTVFQLARLAAQGTYRCVPCRFRFRLHRH
jgi:hypothetical protein